MILAMLALRCRLLGLVNVSMLSFFLAMRLSCSIVNELKCVRAIPRLETSSCWCKVDSTIIIGENPFMVAILDVQCRLKVCCEEEEIWIWIQVLLSKASLSVLLDLTNIFNQWEQLQALFVMKYSKNIKIWLIRVFRPKNSISTSSRHGVVHFESKLLSRGKFSARSGATHVEFGI